MPEQLGTVMSVSEGLALVRLDRNAGCAACAGSGCRQVSLLKLFRSSCPTLRIPVPRNRLPAPGDRVRLGLSDDDVSVLALVGYLLPLLTMAAAASLATLAGGADAAAAGAGAAGLAVGLMLTRMPAFRRTPTLHPLN